MTHELLFNARGEQLPRIEHILGIGGLIDFSSLTLLPSLLSLRAASLSLPSCTLSSFLIYFLSKLHPLYSHFLLSTFIHPPHLQTSRKF